MPARLSGNERLILEHVGQVARDSSSQAEELRGLLGDQTERLEFLAQKLERQHDEVHGQGHEVARLSDVIGDREQSVRDLLAGFEDRQNRERSELQRRVAELSVNRDALATRLDAVTDDAGRLEQELDKQRRETAAQRREMEGVAGGLADWVRQNTERSLAQETKTEELRRGLIQVQQRLDEEAQRHSRRLEELAGKIERGRRALTDKREEHQASVAELEHHGGLLTDGQRDIARQGTKLMRQSPELAKQARWPSTLHDQAERTGDLVRLLWTSWPRRAYRRLAETWRRRVGKLPKTLHPVPAATAARYYVLIIDHRLPTPDQDSGSLRMVNFIRVLQGLGFRVTFLPYNLRLHEPYTGRLQELGVEVVGKPGVDSIARHLEERGAAYDLVILCRVEVASACIDEVRRYCASARVVFDTVDLCYLREIRRAELEEDEEQMAAALRTKEMELGVARRADATVVVSPVEKALLAEEEPDLVVEVVSNIHVRIAGQNNCRQPARIVDIDHAWLARLTRPTRLPPWSTGSGLPCAGRGISAGVPTPCTPSHTWHRLPKLHTVARRSTVVGV